MWKNGPGGVRAHAGLYAAGKERIRKEPYGSVLIIGPYNYPFQLLMEPLISAIAAGNCAVVRTSKQTSAYIGGYPSYAAACLPSGIYLVRGGRQGG